MNYSRQMILPEVGVEGQARLTKARCLVIGAGGLGSPALMYLAAAGVGKIGICDSDALEESNLHRQVLFAANEVGKNKADLAAQRLCALNPLIEVVSYPFRLTKENVPQLFSEYDLVLDCTDNFRTKFLLNDAAYLYKKPLIRASIYQFEGQLQTYLPDRGDPCLRCLWKEAPKEGCIGNCQQVGVLGPVAGFFGVLQAIEALKFFLKMPLLAGILFVDLIHYAQYEIAHSRTNECPLCGENPSIIELADGPSWDIQFSPDIIKRFCLIDLREEDEAAERPFPLFAAHMPLSSFDANMLESSVSYLLVCQRGKRSAYLAEKLRLEGFHNVYSLIGGMDRISLGNESTPVYATVK